MEEQRVDNTTVSSIPPSKIEKKPFCQRVGMHISSEQCSGMQSHNEGCFGCAALTRVCEDCRRAYVNVPAVGLCSNCLQTQLDEELLLSPTPSGKGSIWCQIFKKAISLDMCFATQGQEGCFNCNAASRLCEKCKKHPSRFPQYGLCLHCSTEEYGEGWTPENGPVIYSESPQKKYNGEENNEEVLSEKKVVTKAKKRALLPKARKILHGKERISVSLLAAELKIRYERAREIMVQLEAEGLVGPSKGTAPRDVLPPLSKSSAKKNLDDDHCATITSPVIRKLEQMLRLFPGGELENTLKEAIWELKKLDLARGFFEKLFHP